MLGEAYTSVWELSGNCSFPLGSTPGNFPFFLGLPLCPIQAQPSIHQGFEVGLAGDWSVDSNFELHKINLNSWSLARIPTFPLTDFQPENELGYRRGTVNEVRDSVGERGGEDGMQRLAQQIRFPPPAP